ncbi:MAG: Rubredoxin reductase [Clostridia bacterium 41_269]|nr:MAG: Rubredoxin reductase [Clostridia bacterium 41_269]
MKILVVGGSAAGLTAASTIKRRKPDAQVIVFEKSGDVSYSACGMPYNLLEKDKPAESLYALSFKEITEVRGIDYRLHSEVLSIDPQKGRAVVYDRENSKEYAEEYDFLVYAAGALPNRLPLKGFDQHNAFYFKTLDDLRRVKKFIYEKKPKRACLIGAGFVNLELSEIFKELGMDVVVLEKMDKILPSFEPEIRQKAEEYLKKKGVLLETSVEVNYLDGNAVDTSIGRIPCDFVIAAVGIKPNAEIIREAGGEIGYKGAVKVNSYLETSLDNVFAAGDCAEHYVRVLDRNLYMPLGTTANKQGKIVGHNLSFPNSKKPFYGINQTSVFKIFDYTVGTTGLFSQQLEEEGISWNKSVVDVRTRGAYPGGGKMRVCLLFEKGSGRILGCQMVGEDVVAKRLDVAAAAMYAGLTVFELAELDLSYAPPYSPVWDPLLVAANQALKAV